MPAGGRAPWSSLPTPRSAFVASANALRAARPDYVVADRRGLAWRGPQSRRKALSLDDAAGALRRTLRVEASLSEPVEPAARDSPSRARTPMTWPRWSSPRARPDPPRPSLYRHGQLEAQRDALMATYSLTSRSPRGRICAIRHPRAGARDHVGGAGHGRLLTRVTRRQRLRQCGERDPSNHHLRVSGGACQRRRHRDGWMTVSERR